MSYSFATRETFGRPSEKHAYGRRICIIILLALISRSSLAYYIVQLRNGRPNWFGKPTWHEWDGHLRAREPGVCYIYRPQPAKGDVEYTIIYNPPGTVPVSAIGYSRSRYCPKTKYTLPGRMIMAVVLDPDNLEGIHLVNLTALSPDAAFHEAGYVSLEPGTPTGDPGGILYNTATDPKPGIYAWLKKDGGKDWERKRVYYPGNVYKVPDPSNLLQRADRNEKFLYGNLRGLAEQYIFKEQGGGDGLDNDLEIISQGPETMGYEERFQKYLSDIIAIGDTSISRGASEVEDTDMAPLLGRRHQKNNEVISYMEGLVDLHQDPNIQPNPQRDVPVANIQRSPSSSEIQTEETIQQSQNLERPMELIDDGLENEAPGSETQEQGAGLLENFDESLEQDDVEDIIGRPGVDVMMESLSGNVGQPQLFHGPGDDSPLYPTTSSARRRGPRPLSLMEDSFVDPGPSALDQTYRLQDEAEIDGDESFEVGPQRRMRRPSRR
ncbi:hypothetical protein TWF281_005329 [Arthrobotrys megalospora]